MSSLVKMTRIVLTFDILHWFLKQTWHQGKSPLQILFYPQSLSAEPRSESQTANEPFCQPAKLHSQIITEACLWVFNPGTKDNFQFRINRSLFRAVSKCLKYVWICEFCDSRRWTFQPHPLNSLLLSGSNVTKLLKLFSIHFMASAYSNWLWNEEY